MVMPAEATENWIAHQIWMVLPSPSERQCNGNKGGGQVKARAAKRATAMATRMVSNNKGNGNGKESGQATATTTAVGDNDGRDVGNEDGANKGGVGSMAKATVTRVAGESWGR
jgi:hypothetical protein